MRAERNLDCMDCSTCWICGLCHKHYSDSTKAEGCCCLGIKV